MSVEEDVELRDLVTQTLEVNGCLSKIRAQLRANIFLALDDGEDFQKNGPLVNKKTKEFLQSEAGRTMFCLVREFLEFFDLDFTISVYEPETYMGTDYQYEGRSKIIEDLGISQLKDNSTLPLLLQLIQLAQVSMKTEDIDNISNVCIREDLNEIKNNKINETELNSGSLNCEANNPSVLNETFNVSVPSVNVKHNDKFKTKRNEDFLSDDEICSSFKDQQSEMEFSPPILKDKSHSKFEINDKLKLTSQKTEKLKTKGSLSSLADLPPLQLNKSRNDTMLLPSLYSKEFKSNQNLKELDKLFELESASLNNYEEDFISESDLNFSKASDSFINESLHNNSSKNSLSSEIKSDHDESSVTSDDLLNSPT